MQGAGPVLARGGPDVGAPASKSPPLRAPQLWSPHQPQSYGPEEMKSLLMRIIIIILSPRLSSTDRAFWRPQSREKQLMLGVMVPPGQIKH